VLKMMRESPIGPASVLSKTRNPSQIPTTAPTAVPSVAATPVTFGDRERGRGRALLETERIVEGTYTASAKRATLTIAPPALPAHAEETGKATR